MSTQSEAKTSSGAEATGGDARRTGLFVGGAVACLAITALFEIASRPAEIQEYGKVGEEFYPDFADPTLATNLSVKVIDAEELKPLEFSVKQSENGRWVIPSHHDYPADAEDQLKQVGDVYLGQLPANVLIANTATSWSGTRWTMLVWPLPTDPVEKQRFLRFALGRLRRFDIRECSTCICQPSVGIDAYCM